MVDRPSSVTTITEHLDVLSKSYYSNNVTAANLIGEPIRLLVSWHLLNLTYVIL